MLASPQSVTYDSVANDLNRTIVDKTSSIYESSDGTLKLTVSHQESKSRTRHLVRLDRTVLAADPLTSVNAYQKAGVYIVIDEPIFGFDNGDLDNQVDALLAWLTTANISAILDNRH